MKLIVAEHGSERAREAWDGADRVVSSLLLYPEARAAVARATRRRRLRRSRVAAGRAELERLWRDVDRLAPTETLAVRAAALAEAHLLRGYDAVHLASLEQLDDGETALVSADRDLLRAARSLGFATVPLD